MTRARAIATVMEVLIVALPIAYAADLHRLLGFSFYNEQLLALVLTLALSRTFLTVLENESASIAWRVLAAALAAVTLGVGVYIAAYYPSISMEAPFQPGWLLALSAVMFGALMLTLRSAAGIGILAVVLLFLAYGLFGHLMPGEMRSRQVTIPELLIYLTIDANGVLGTALSVATLIVVPFLLFGQLLARCGAADFFNDISLSVMGRYRGGPAKVAVTASALFGSISGSAVGNVVGTGVVTIPMMKRSGFPAHYAGAVEAVASTGGQLVPPIMGAAAFIMADFIGVDYSEVMLAALPSALLYYLAVFINVDLLAAKGNMKRVDEKELPSARASFLIGWHFLIPFAVLFYALFALHQRPERAAIWSIAALVIISAVLGYRGKRIGLSDLWFVLASAGKAAKDLIIVCAAAGLIIGILNLSGLAFNLTLHIINASGNSVVLLALITAVISIVLGMGMPTVGVYILLATLVAPAMVEVGVSVMAAHLFVFYFGLLSMVTPPVALAAFAGANIAEANAWTTSWTAMKLAWTAYIVPFLFIFAPSLLLEGSAIQVMWALTTAIIGIFMTTAGIVGHFRERLGIWQRTVLVAGGVLALAPAGLFENAIYTDFVGVGVFIGYCALSWVRIGRAVA